MARHMWQLVRYLRDMFGLFLFALFVMGGASSAEKDILNVETYKGKVSMVVLQMIFDQK